MILAHELEHLGREVLGSKPLEHPDGACLAVPFGVPREGGECLGPEILG